MERTMTLRRGGLAAFGAFARQLRDAWRRWRAEAERRRDIAATHAMLQGLDDATLRDLALDRSELSSAAIEAGSRLQRQRRR